MPETKFDPSHHGDEVIVTAEKDKLQVDVKIQTARDEHRVYKFTFETQSQMERLFPTIMKGLRNA